MIEPTAISVDRCWPYLITAMLTGANVLARYTSSPAIVFVLFGVQVA